MDKLLTKNNVLIISFVYVLYLVDTLVFSKCYGDRWCPLNINHLDSIFVYVFLPLFPTFLLSFPVYYMRDEIFQSWMSLTKWWIPLSIVVTLLIPEEVGGFISVPYQSVLALLGAGTFFLVSVILIVWKWFALRKAGN
jgi:hypothetical protein